MVKNMLPNARDTRDPGLIPGLGRSPGGGNGNPLQYPGLENPTDRGAWRATVHGVAKNPDVTEHTQLSGLCTQWHIIQQFIRNETHMPQHG